MLVLKALLFIALIILGIPVSVLLIQVLASLFWLTRSRKIAILDNLSSVAIIVPAHNESVGIIRTIKSILPQLKHSDQLIVIADNCSDDTANIASDLGAKVVIRKSETLRGKGYALDFGLKYLETNPPQVVIMIDADCTISENGIAALTHACITHKRPIQALDLMLSPPNAGLKTKIAEFAWLVKNQVRPLGFKVLGLPCQLMGTGMAFLWEDISNISLATGHIAEDMKLGIDLCGIDKAPLFFPQACVSSYFPVTQSAAKTQRARWEHGHLSVILSDAPKLFLKAFQSKNGQMLGMAFDLIVPPLAILTLMCVFLSVLILLIHQWISVSVFLSSAVLLLFFLAISILIAWYFFARTVISFRQLCYAPIYALVKIPLYIKFFVNRQVEWVRSKRD